MSSLKIKIYPTENEYFEYLEKPYPCSSRNPEWIKKIPTYYTENKQIDELNMPTSTIKNCMPVRDMIGCGFTIPLPCDVWVEKFKTEEGDELTNFRWALGSLPLITPHVMKQSNGIPVPKGFCEQTYRFNNFWIIETPKNWSCIFKHPSYYDDLPFKVLELTSDLAASHVGRDLELFVLDVEVIARSYDEEAVVAIGTRK